MICGDLFSSRFCNRFGHVPASYGLCSNESNPVRDPTFTVTACHLSAEAPECSQATELLAVRGGSFSQISRAIDNGSAYGL